jgi:hypothetical protein
VFSELLNRPCNIYRLLNWDNFDFSTTDEGEVDESESWTLVESAVCRVEEIDTSADRRSDGQVETGTNILYFELGVDVNVTDRVEVSHPTIAELPVQLFHVMKISEIEGFDEFHHLEAEVIHIDWETVS